LTRSGKVKGDAVQTFGVDIVAVDRIRVAAERADGTLETIFTPSELAECLKRRCSYARLAAVLAVKEALLKAAGFGLHEGFRFREIEVYNHRSGAPRLRLSGRIGELIGDDAGERCLVSSAFTDRFACAVVALQPEGIE
jgi:holo-[acyl-carrier protein] synthase